MRPVLEKSITIKGLLEWLMVEAVSSNLSTTKNKTKKTE
jgi:hypothetical protein